ncbi:hypothetical protein [Microbacterium profundi]
MSEHSTALVDGLIHLPRVRKNDQEELVDHLLRMSERLPEITIKVATKAMGKRWQQIAPHSPTALVVPLVEMIFDTDRAGLFEVELHAQFVFLSAFPTLPESMAMQIAFGCRVGEEAARKYARLFARAEQRGITADALVAELDAAGSVPKDRIYHLLRGESRRRPDEERMKQGIAFLRTTAALTPEPGRAPLLCTIAWLHWARGQRAIAMSYLEEARRVEPSHILTCGLTVFFTAGVPAWIQV